MKITPASLTINQLFGSTNEQYVIPTYQRRYSWHDQQVWDLIDDIQLIEGDETHLLGSIVCLAGHHVAGINQLELVDGQQRITTVSIILHCIQQSLNEKSGPDAASSFNHLLYARSLGGPQADKVSLDSLDRDDFLNLIRCDESSEVTNARLKGAFVIVRSWLLAKSAEEITAFLYRLANQAIIIRLDVSEAKDAFKLFETINNRGLKLSPTDIIKNFLLGNSARFGKEKLDEARKCWSQILRHLDGTVTDTFFRHYLTSLVKSRVTASQVVATFKKVFMTGVYEADALPERHLYVEQYDEEGEEYDDLAVDTEASLSLGTGKVAFSDFLSNLVQSAKAFGELYRGDTGNKKIDRHLRSLRMIKALQTYGFLMHLRVGGCSDKIFIEVLKLTESFVLRRHICKKRTNETDSLFAKLCTISPADPIADVKASYRELTPSDDEFCEEFSKTNFTGSLERARYCLEKIELCKHGKHEELRVLGGEDVHVEHIIPQKIKTKRAKEEFGDWVDYLGSKSLAEHPKYIGLIGNLTLFAGELNIVASNNPFGRKKQSYSESGILITQELSEMKNFKFKQVEDRATQFAKLAVEIWPRP